MRYFLTTEAVRSAVAGIADAAKTGKPSTATEKADMTKKTPESTLPLPKRPRGRPRKPPVEKKRRTEGQISALGRRNGKAVRKKYGSWVGVPGFYYQQTPRWP